MFFKFFIFQATSQFFLKFCITHSTFMKYNSSVLSQLKRYILWSKATHEGVNFWDFRNPESKFDKFLISILKRQVTSSSDFSSFFSVITHNSFVNFQFMHFLIWTKGSQESTSFGKFKCSDKKLPNSMCHFRTSFSSNFAWLFGVMKYNSSVIFYVKHYILCTKGTNQSVNFLDFLVLGSKFTKFLLFLKEKICFSSNFTPLFSIMRHSWNFMYFQQKEPIKVQIGWNFT